MMKPKWMLMTAVAMLALSLVTAGKTGDREGNRARYATATASGSRLARLAEIPMTNDSVANKALSNPNGWPTWGPRYAIDGSPLTRWATDQNESWLKLAVQAKPPIARVVIEWGKSYGVSYRIVTSDDGKTWKPAAAKDAGQGGVESFELNPPLEAAFIKIEIAKTSGQGAEIVDVGLYGATGESAAAPAGFYGPELGKQGGEPRFKYRGIVEGFYNDPWPHQERLRMIAFLENAGYNYYIYAPKNDPYQRQWWFKPYPEAELANFAELAAACRAHGITFNYGLSPGLDMDYDAARDLAALKEKLKSLHGAGLRAFTICLDDIPHSRQVNRETALAQVKMINEVHAYLKTLAPDVQLFFVPTVYSRTYSYQRQNKPARADYLAALAGLDPAIGIFWTGPGEIFSEQIKTGQAKELKDLWRRPVLIWDNYPVNDWHLRHNIFTGPYLGRSADLPDAASGMFLNPMYLPNASKIALFTAGRYLNSKEYDPWKAYSQAIALLGGESGAKALRTLSDCLIVHPVFSDLAVETTPVYQAIAEYQSSRANPARRDELAAKLKAMFTAYADNPRDLARIADQALAAELASPSVKLSLYGQAGLKCLELDAERSPDKKAALRRELAALQEKARAIPWKLADESTTLPAMYVGRQTGNRSALDDFISRSLAEGK
jgi:hypothetical protein